MDHGSGDGGSPAVGTSCRANRGGPTEGELEFCWADANRRGRAREKVTGAWVAAGGDGAARVKATTQARMLEVEGEW